MRLVSIGGRWVWPGDLIGVYAAGPDCTEPVPADCQTIAHHNVYGLLFDARSTDHVADAIHLARCTTVYE